MSGVLKPCIPFIKRAEELDNDLTNPDGKTIAYFCRLYAIRQALRIRGDHPEAKAEIEAFVAPLLEQAEGEMCMFTYLFPFLIYISLSLHLTNIQPPRHRSLVHLTRKARISVRAMHLVFSLRRTTKTEQVNIVLYSSEHFCFNFVGFRTD